MTLRPALHLLTAGAALTLLAACGSDGGSADGSSNGAASTPGKSATTNGAVAKQASDGDSPEDPCDVTDQATVASVFPGAGAGKPGQTRNCSYTFANGSVNVFLYAGDLATYKKGAVANGIKVTPVQVGDAALRDQLHAVTVQQGDVLFGVQALPKSGLTDADFAVYDKQTLALATRIAAAL